MSIMDVSTSFLDRSGRFALVPVGLTMARGTIRFVNR